VPTFVLAIRSFFRYGSFGRWLYEGGIAGTPKQVTLTTTLPPAIFVLVEHLEHLVAGTGTSPSAQLLAVGVLAQLVVGLLCLALVRMIFHVAERVIDCIAQGFHSHPSLSALAKREWHDPSITLVMKSPAYPHGRVGKHLGA